MRYLAIDYGLRRIGLATCDAGEIIVSPLCQLDIAKRKTEWVFEQLKIIIAANEIEAVVVGLPVNMDGSEGDQARLTRQFAEKLQDHCGLPVHLQDERLSSAAADEKLSVAGFSRQKHKARRDMLAACEILQSFLDR